jgi:hypothetical protein
VLARLSLSVIEGNCEVVTIDVRGGGASNLQIDGASSERQDSDDQGDDQCHSTWLLIRRLTHLATRIKLGENDGTLNLRVEKSDRVHLRVMEREANRGWAGTGVK